MLAHPERPRARPQCPAEGSTAPGLAGLAASEGGPHFSALPSSGRVTVRRTKGNGLEGTARPGAKERTEGRGWVSAFRSQVGSVAAAPEGRNVTACGLIALFQPQAQASWHQGRSTEPLPRGNPPRMW